MNNKENLQDETLKLIQKLGIKNAEADFFGTDNPHYSKEQAKHKKSKLNEKGTLNNSHLKAPLQKNVTNETKTKLRTEVNTSKADLMKQKNKKKTQMPIPPTIKRDQFSPSTPTESEKQASTPAITKKKNKTPQTPTTQSSQKPTDATSIYKKPQTIPPQNTNTPEKFAALDGKDTKLPFAELDDMVTAWHSIPLPGISRQKKSKSYIKLSLAQLDVQRKTAQSFLDKEVEAFQKQRKSHSDGDDKWIQQVLKAGTLSDKIAAMTLRIQQSPVHYLDTLDSLLNMATKGQMRTAQMASEALKDLFVSNLLPPGRKLISFNARPLNSPGAKPQHLVLWLFEDLLKSRYALFVGSLQQGLNHTVESYKRFALSAIADLLSSHPEQEALLLASLTNKLGDPGRKVASKSAFLLQQLLKDHPAMKEVVIREVQQFLHRPNLNPRAIYQAIIFLNQVYFTKSDGELTSRLVSTYLTLFENAVKEIAGKEKAQLKREEKPNSKKKKKKRANEVEARLLSALLSGINRAHPYLPKDYTSLATHLQTLFRISHDQNPRVSVQALMLLHQVVLSREGDDPLAGRFFSTLYTKLLSLDANAMSQPLMFLNLLYKALKRDTSLPRVSAFCKRILQVFCSGSSAICAGALFLVSQVITHHPPELANTLFQKENPPCAQTNSEEPVPNLAQSVAYDPQKRDPRYSGAETTALWEACLMINHFHPSVALFAQRLLDPSNRVIQYAGDPLVDFSLMPFLDRLAFKNPKSKDSRQISNMRRQAITSDPSLGLPVNSEGFLELEQVPADHAFFRTFFETKALQEKAGKKKKKKSEEVDNVLSDERDGTDSEEEEFVTKLAEGMMHTKAGPDFDDDDVSDFGNFSSDDEAENRQTVNGEESGDLDEFMDMDDDDDASGPEAAFEDDSMPEDSEADSEDGLSVNKTAAMPTRIGNNNSDPKKKNKRTRTKSTDWLADMDEYNHLIDADFNAETGDTDDTHKPKSNYKRGKA